MSGFGHGLIAHSDTAALVALIVLLPLLVLYTLRVHYGLRVPLRRIPPLSQLPDLELQSVESGQPVTLCQATGCSDMAGPEVVAGNAVYDYLCAQQALADEPAPFLTDGPVALLLAMNARQARRTQHQLPPAASSDELLYSGPALPALASQMSLEQKPLRSSATVLAGTFEGQGLAAGECVLASSTPAAVAPGDGTAAALTGASLRSASQESRADQLPLPGEDLYAGGAYLHRPLLQGSLLAQDAARWLITITILVTVLLASLGYGGRP